MEDASGGATMVPPPIVSQKRAQGEQGPVHNRRQNLGKHIQNKDPPITRSVPLVPVLLVVGINFQLSFSEGQI